MKIFLVSHEGFASGIARAATFILGTQLNFEIHELTDSGITDFNKALEESLRNEHDEILLLGDLKGGSPLNQSMVLLEKLKIPKNRIKIFGNINLAFLIANSQATALKEIVVDECSGITELETIIKKNDGDE